MLLTNPPNIPLLYTNGIDTDNFVGEISPSTVGAAIGCPTRTVSRNKILFDK